jgi:hypothetical protein
MSPMMNDMLVHEVMPRLRNTVRSVPKVGHEDNEEIIQDSTLMAARNLDWESFLDSHSPRHRTAILVLVKGCMMREAGKRCRLKDSAALNLKRRIAASHI